MVRQLADTRKTFAEHRRLLTAGGWLSLLASTCHIDLRRFEAAGTWLRTTAQTAKYAEHPEIAAWCLETQAWQAVTTGDYRRALSRRATRGMSRAERPRVRTGEDVSLPRGPWARPTGSDRRITE
jgi:hypothetical protein